MLRSNGPTWCDDGVPFEQLGQPWMTSSAGITTSLPAGGISNVASNYVSSWLAQVATGLSDSTLVWSQTSSSSRTASRGCHAAASYVDCSNCDPGMFDVSADPG
nr:hypothetical protein CFP56_03077 [Quercus suber]